MKSKDLAASDYTFFQLEVKVSLLIRVGIIVQIISEQETTHRLLLFCAVYVRIPCNTTRFGNFAT